MHDFDLISLDLESSGVNENSETILSVGAVRFSDMTSFYMEARHEVLTVTPEAMRVNGFDITTLDAVSKSSLTEIDAKFLEWLKEDKFFKEGGKFCLIPLGMNVGTFDMAFVRRYLPMSAKLFGYRSLDLNSLVFEEAVRLNRPYREVKKAAKVLGLTVANEYVPDLKPHHALWDAYSNVGVYRYFSEHRTKEVGDVAWEGGRAS